MKLRHFSVSSPLRLSPFIQSREHAGLPASRGSLIGLGTSGSGHTRERAPWSFSATVISLLASNAASFACLGGEIGRRNGLKRRKRALHNTLRLNQLTPKTQYGQGFLGVFVFAPSRRTPHHFHSRSDTGTDLNLAAPWHETSGRPTRKLLKLLHPKSSNMISSYFRDRHVAR